MALRTAPPLEGATPSETTSLHNAAADGAAAGIHPRDGKGLAVKERVTTDIVTGNRVPSWKERKAMMRGRDGEDDRQDADAKTTEPGGDGKAARGLENPRSTPGKAIRACQAKKSPL